MRLIDADTLKAEFTGNFHETWHYTGVRAVVDVAPTIDAVPVVHGKWIEKLIPTGVSAFGVDKMTCEEEECSVCHELYWVGEKKNYCPNCGAKMDN